MLKSPSQKSVRHVAMDLLARREHSRMELVKKLKQRQFDSDEIDICLNKLVADGLLSDTRFTQAYVRMRSQRGFGKHRILLELDERGIDSTLAQQVLADEAINWQQLAQAVRVKKFGAKPASDFTEKAKQMRFLQYRGFGHDVINQTL